MTTSRINIGLLGCGVVGGGLVDLVSRNSARIARASGVHIDIKRAFVRDFHKPRGVPTTAVAHDVVGADDVDVVIEVMGGTSLAYDLVATALESGKHVVTANKALLATRGRELFELAAQHRRHLGFEASVCGGIPIIGALRAGLVGNEISGLRGIINGTTNFVLTQMSRGATPREALAEARRRGFCEADASFDLDGIDAAQKLVLLVRLAFGIEVQMRDVQCEGMSHIDTEDLAQAQALGYVVKHIAEAQRRAGGLDLQVRPVLIARQHPLAAVNDENNAVELQGDAVGDILFFGKGAGAGPTASAVLSDIVDIAQRRDVAPVEPEVLQGSAPSEDQPSREPQRHYLRFPIVDAPGVIGAITTALGKHGVSIEHANAQLLSGAKTGAGSVVIVVHPCHEHRLQAALAEVTMLAHLRGRPVVLPLLGADAGADSSCVLPQPGCAPHTTGVAKLVA